MRTIVKGFAVLVAAVAVTACGQSGVGARNGTMAVQSMWTSCEVNAPDSPIFGDASAIELPLLRDDFEPAAAIVCDAKPQKRPDGGEDLVAMENRADDVTALVTALRLPDAPRTSGACTADLPVVAWFALLDSSGRWIRPGAPIDACGKIRIEVRDAVSTLTLTTISSRTVRELESAQAAATGCSQIHSDMIGTEMTQDPKTRPTSFTYLLGPVPRIRLCAYRVPASEQGSGKPAGNFEYGAILTPDRRASIEAALATIGAVRPCTTLASRFAMLWAVDSMGGQVSVELDGCQRIMASPDNGPYTFGQSDPALIALLDKP